MHLPWNKRKTNEKGENKNDTKISCASKLTFICMKANVHNAKEMFMYVENKHRKIRVKKFKIKIKMHQAQWPEASSRCSLFPTINGEKEAPNLCSSNHKKYKNKINPTHRGCYKPSKYPLAHVPPRGRP